jgi:diguanylate cyclase (GGDEF)-like protein/PAS domain S-box-containing protein
MFDFWDAQLGPFTAGLFFSAGFSFFIAVFVQRWRETVGIRFFTVQLVMQIVWTLSVALEILAPDLTTKVFWHKVSRIGVLGVPVAWMYFVFFYTDQSRWLSRRVSVLLFSVLGVLLVFAFTNDSHFLFWSSVKLTPGTGFGAEYGRGPVYWISVGISFALLLVAWGELIWMGLRSAMVYRRQAVLLILAGGFPSIFSILFVLGLTGQFDYTPYAFVLTSLTASLAILRYRFYNLVPVARGKLLQILPDGILALDALGRVIDVNQTFLRVLELKTAPIGQPLEYALTGSKVLSDGLRQSLDVLLDHTRPCVVEVANGSFYEIAALDLEVRPGTPHGKLIVLRDVTVSQLAAQAKQHSEDNFRRLFDANPFPMAILSKEQLAIFQANQAMLDYFQALRDEMIGRRVISYLGRPELNEEINRELDSEGQVRSKPVDIKHPNGRHSHVMLNIFPVEYYGEPRWVATFADITERKHFEDAEREQRELAEVALETSTLLTSTLNLEEVLDRILDHVSRLVPYQSASVILADEQGIGRVARARGYVENGHESPLGKAFFSLENTFNLRWMIQHRAAMIIPDVSKDPNWILFPGQEWMRAHLGAPMFTQDGIAGFLSLDHPIVGFFNQSDASRLQIYTAQAGIAIQNAGLFSRLQKIAHEGEVLQEIARAVGSSLDFDLVIDRVFELISRLVPSDSVGVQMIEGDEIILRAFPESERDKIPLGLRWKLEGTANARVMVERRPMHFPDVQAEFVDYRNLPEKKIRSVLMIPLISGGAVIGFLSLDSWYLNHFTREDERLASLFSTSIAVALENSLLYAETQRRLKVQSILNQISRVVSNKLNLKGVLDLVWEQINRFLDASYFLIAAKSNDHDDWVVSYNRQAGVLQSEPETLDNHQVMKYVIQNKRVLFLRRRNEVEIFERVTGLQLQFDTKHSLMVVPLQVSGVVTGAMEIFNVDHDLAYSLDDFELFSSIAAQVAVSVENSNLFEETRRKAEEMEILNRVGLAITAGLDREQVLQTLFEQCRLTMPVDCFYVSLYHRETDTLEFPVFYDQGKYLDIQTLTLSENPGITNQVLRERRTYYLADMSDPVTMAKHALIHLGGEASRSYVGVPLVLREQTIGVISVQSTQPNAYSPQQIHLLEMISIQAAIAIENARLYSEAQLLATTDFLTGMLNRRELFMRADQEFERARRYRHQLAVLMIDIDHFKLVNDTFGHLAGDQVLRSLARVCQQNMRHVDVLGRYGGEEILILMPETDQGKALAGAERLRKEIDEMMVDTESGEVHVTVSIGLVSYQFERGSNLEMLIGQADTALFAAKDAGRNRVHVFKANT